MTWYVNDVKSSHVDGKENDKLLIFLHAADGIGKVKVNRTKRHEHLGMILDYTVPGAPLVDMRTCLKTMIEEFPEKIGKVKCPGTENYLKLTMHLTHWEMPRGRFFTNLQ